MNSNGLPTTGLRAGPARSFVPQQLRFCFKVDEDLEVAEARLLELGAGKPGHQPHGDKARILTDPARDSARPCEPANGRMPEPAGACRRAPHGALAPRPRVGTFVL